MLRKPFDGKITKPGWYCSLGMTLGLSPKGLWSMDYDFPGFGQLRSSCIRRPNLPWILPPSSWVRSNQFLGEGLWSRPPPKTVLCTHLGEDRGNTQEVRLALCMQIKATQFVSMSQLAAKFVNSLPCLICPHLELTCHTLFFRALTFILLYIWVFLISLEVWASGIPLSPDGHHHQLLSA